jgi:molybdate transport system regulatory protein
MRHRVMVDGVFIFGPGKADVLDAIGKTGSLAAAAKSIGMSYMRIWHLVKQMQGIFREPVVELHRGGKTRGAKLTPAGKKALALYRRMEKEAIEATEETWREFCAMVRHRAEVEED